MLISAKTIIEKSLDLYKQHYLLYLRYMILLFIPTGILGVARAILGSFTQAVFMYGLGMTILIYIIVFLTGSLVSLWISLAFLRALAQTINGEKTLDPLEEIQKSTKYIIPALIASILTGLAVLGGLILFIIPGIIFAIWLAFTMYSVVLDEQNGVSALHHSKQLVSGRWGEVFWRLLAPGVVFGMLAIVAQWITGWPFEQLLETYQDGDVSFALLLTLYTLFGVAISLLVTPLSSLAPTILYLELKKTPVKIKNPNPSDKIPSEPPLK